MTAFLWAALGFLVLSLVAGGVFVGLSGWRTWRAFVSLAAAGGAGVERLLTSAEQLAARTEHAAARGEELLIAVERLERSTARARILLRALGEVRDTLRPLEAFVPRK